MGFITETVEETVTIYSSEERQRIINLQVEILRSYSSKISEDEWDLLEDILSEDPMTNSQFEEYISSLLLRPIIQGFKY